MSKPGAVSNETVKRLKEYNSRRSMALNVFRPQAHQEPFFRHYAKEILLRGGNRCLAAGTVIWRDGRACYLEELKIGDRIAAFNVGLCEAEVLAVSHFIEDAYCITTECGQELCGTSDHPVLLRSGDWAELQDIRVGQEIQMADPLTGKLWTSSVTGKSQKPEQHIVAISTSTQSYISNHIVSSNSGKSTCAAVLFAAIATDTPITFNDGTVMDMRQPWQKGRCLTMWIIGYDIKHIGQTIYRLLFKPDLFRTIVDPKTNQLRAWRRWDEEDAKLEHQTRASNPLIPKAFVDPQSWDWENKKGKEFKSVTIWHPQTHEPLAQIFAYTSKGEPKAGDPVDVVFIDEAIEYPENYSEWQARLVDKRGRLFWSSWPKSDNEALRSLTQRAEACKGDEEPLVREFVIKMSENKALDKKSVNEALAGFTTEAEKRARDLGEYVTDLQRVYPQYNKEEHCVTIDAIDSIPKDDGISRELSKYDGIPPRDWTKELILDPGTAHPCVLLCAIPPLNFGSFRIAYQEIYPGRKDPYELAELIAKETRGQSFYRFIIDYRAGRQQTIGSTDTVVNNYIQAFKRYRLKSISLGYRFVWGSDNVGARMLKLSEWLHYEDGANFKAGQDANHDSYPVLRVVNHRCPQLCNQLKDYRLATINNVLMESRPAPGQKADAVQCFDEETEVLTRTGWKFFKDITLDDQLGTVTLPDLELQYQFPTKLIARHHSGDMVKIKSKRLNLMVTPEHRMVVRGSTGKIKIKLASELNKTDRIPLCPRSWNGVRPILILDASHTGTKKQIDWIPNIVDFAEFMGWFIAEGCTVKLGKPGRGHQVIITQSKEWGCELLEDCLRRNVFNFHKDRNNYRVSNKQLWHYLRPLGKSHEKYVPSWIKNADSEVIAAFLKGYIAGDGHARKNGAFETSSASKRLSDDIQELFLKQGISASIMIRDMQPGCIRGRPVIANHQAHVVHTAHKILEATLYTDVGNNRTCIPLFSRCHYDGMVYCASVPNTTLVVRRHGRVHVSGNCLEYWAASNPRYVPYSLQPEDGGAAYLEWLRTFGRKKKDRGSGSQIGPNYSAG